SFYEACADAYAIIQTGETAVYANIMLDKGIV
ncbi:fucose isomerase, partial [Romboutsia ilealis]|nr:fucose isomerase [Romboutsia ilealis]